jgi:hypothetical protein
MLLEYAETNSFNTSGAHHEFPKWGRPPKAASPILGGAAGDRPHYVLRCYYKPWPPHILKALATHSLKNICYPHIIQATCFESCPVAIFPSKRWFSHPAPPACSHARMLACSPARLLACSPARLLACLPACLRLLACLPFGRGPWVDDAHMGLTSNTKSTQI